MSKKLNFFLIPHNIFMGIGFIFYLIIPVVIGTFKYFEAYPGMMKWHNDFSSASKNIIVYITSIPFLFSFYLLGSKLGAVRLFRQQPKIKLFIFNAKENFMLYLIACSALITSSLLFINNLNISFTGYDSYNTDLLGTFATISMFSLFFAYYSRVKSTKLLFVTTLFICNIFLLGMGTRMYMTIPIISSMLYLIYYSSFKVSIFKISFYILISILILVTVATWRIEGSYDFEFMIYIFFAEPTLHGGVYQLT